MIYITFAGGMTLVCAGWLIFRGIHWLKTKRLDWKEEAKQLVFLVNLLVIARFIFFPFELLDGKIQPLIFDSSLLWPLWVNFVPFVNILQYDTAFDLLLNLIGNVGMFIPTGILLPLIYKKQNGFGRVVLTGFLISLTIEVIQLPFAMRASDVDDLILNTLGCAIGYGIFALVRAVVCLIKKIKTP